MANNIPVGNIDFINGAEALSALQRNPQIAPVAFSYASGGGLATSFSASTLYAVVVNGGTVTVAATSNPMATYTFGAGAYSFPFGLPMSYTPPGGPCTFTVSTSAAAATIVYK